jgi:hypothetical protein
MFGSWSLHTHLPTILVPNSHMCFLHLPARRYSRASDSIERLIYTQFIMQQLASWASREHSSISQPRVRWLRIYLFMSDVWGLDTML